MVGWLVVRLYPVWFSCSVAQSVNPLSWVRLPDAVAESVSGVADGGDGGGGDDGGGADDGGGGDDGGDGGGGVSGVATCKDELVHGKAMSANEEIEQISLGDLLVG